MAVVIVGTMGESDGRGRCPQRSGPGEMPRVKDQEARGPERKGDRVSRWRERCKGGRVQPGAC